MPARPRRLLATLARAASGLLIGALVGAGLIAWLGRSRPPPAPEVDARSVLTRMQHISRLQTVAVWADVIVEHKQSNPVFFDLLDSRQSALLIIKGKVYAGVDLAKITPDMVRVTPAAAAARDARPLVELTLPAAEIFDVVLEEQKIYDLQRGWIDLFANPADFTSRVLQSARQQARRQLIAKVCDNALLPLAQQNAARQMQDLLQLTQARVQIQTSPPGPCRLSAQPGRPKEQGRQ